MTKDECLLRELCLELLDNGTETERFNQLWIQTGVDLSDETLNIVNRLVTRGAETTAFPIRTVH